MSEPKVSIILIVNKTNKYIRECIESLLNQTIKEIEVIAIYDDSFDNSFELLKEYSSFDSRLHIITQKTNNTGKAKNIGLDNAKGEYVSFFDTNDFFEPNMLEEGYNTAITYDLDFLAYMYDIYDTENNNVISQKNNIKTEHLPPYIPYNYRQFTFNIFKIFEECTRDKMYKREFIQKHNLKFQEQLYSSNIFFVFSTVVLARRIIVIQKTLLHHYFIENNNNINEKYIYDFYNALLSLRNTLRVSGIYNELEKDYINYALHYCLWHYRSLKGSTQKLFGEALRTGWFHELGISNKPEAYLLNCNEKNDYKLFKRLMDGMDVIC
jgi:glycosyltransferase involved in cell wall biosynthesis